MTSWIIVDFRGDRVFLGEQFGADYAMSALRELETMTQSFTELARWRPETKPN